MRVRNGIIAALVVAALTTCGAPAALAQGQGSPLLQAPPRTASAPLPPKGHVFAPPSLLEGAGERPATVLGEAWARAVRAVVDGVKHLIDVETHEARPPLAPAVVAATPPPPFVPSWQAVWAPPNRLRESIAKSPVQVGPVSVSPPTESPTDTRGEHAVLLGARMELPWMVP